jgi:hypothetical protein
MSGSTYQARGEHSSHGKKLGLELVDHDFHAAVKNIEIGLVRHLEKVLDDFSNLWCDGGANCARKESLSIHSGDLPR